MQQKTALNIMEECVKKMTYIEESESKIQNLIVKDSLSKEEIDTVSYILGSILTKFFTTVEKDSGMRGWSIDDMPIASHSLSKKKLTVQGSIWWFEGDKKMVNYQADIAKDTDPNASKLRIKPLIMLY